jgi:hypothetical protein
MKTRRWRLAVLGAGMLLAAASGIAYAAIPGSDGVIHGCVNASGQVRVVDPGAGGSCSSGESALNWNVAGAKGPAGLQGAPGPTGSSGPAGSSGYEQNEEQFSTDQNGDGTGEVDCSSGKRVLDGGYEPSSTQPMHPVVSRPNDGGTGWIVTMTGGVGSFVVTAVCADATEGD